MCANRDPSTMPRWVTLSASQSSSSPSSRSISDLGEVDLTLIGSLSKRKAALPPAGSQRPLKFPRTDTSHHPGRSMNEVEATSRTQGPFESRANPTSPKKRKVLLTRNRELLHSLSKSGSGNLKRNNTLSQLRNAGLGSEATQTRSQGNSREIIVLSDDDDDTPPPGNASNPIILDSDDEADHILTERVPSVQPLLDGSRFTPRRKNTQPRTPPGTSGTGDEVCDAESPSTQEAPLSPHSDVHSVQAVPSVVNGNADQMPLPVQDSSEIQDKLPNTVSENMRVALFPVVSPISLKLRNKGISDRVVMARISSSPNRRHDPPVDASTDSSFVPARGTLHSGPSGSPKDFLRVTTAEPVSPLRPARSVEKQVDSRSKEATTPLRASSSRNIISSTLVSLARNMSIRTSPTPSSVAGRSNSEMSVDPAIITRDNVSSTIGEPF
ncbi:hypothetical protein DFH94DRAFT_376049 [Russula ochroleuca]|uniref:Uncharacterized protein n=1 Tax=Russula ochroleuca TaxID=152965 RepID=A0A9P5TB32_9AGAM|nr:hypothetical protein DFH94DRAFT_376049 [Russula ochroleuca]